VKKQVLRRSERKTNDGGFRVVVVDVRAGRKRFRAESCLLLFFFEDDDAYWWWWSMFFVQQQKQLFERRKTRSAGVGGDGVFLVFVLFCPAKRGHFVFFVFQKQQSQEQISRARRVANLVRREER